MAGKNDVSLLKRSSVELKFTNPMKSKLKIKNLTSRLAGLFLLLVASAVGALADVRLPAIFSDHMVLQAECPVSVWGWASPGEEVSVSLAGQTQTNAANASGKWHVTFSPLKKSNKATTMTVKGSNTLIVEDVLVGEVWLGSGQSNMELLVKNAKSFKREQVDATFPDIRMFTVKKAASTNESTDVTGRWVVCSSNTVGMFSATLYFFGRELHQQLGQPVGLIHSSWGGTPIQAWMPKHAIESSPHHTELVERKKTELAAWPEREKKILASIRAWEAEAAKGTNKNLGEKPRSPSRPDAVQSMPCRLYNAMLHPLVGYRIGGVLWYQGEANARDGETGAAIYTDLQTRLIAGLRAAWGVSELPFLFVQLPNYKDPRATSENSWAYFREAQARTLSVPNTGMAVTIDIGEANDIHPKNKQDVGRRLAQLALGDVYKTKLSGRSPMFREQAIQGREVRLKFNHAEGGLVAREGEITGFVIAGADRKWLPATARMAGDEVILSSADIAAPVAVRYAWADNPKCNLYNRAGLPLSPFRTDSWK